MYQMQLVMAQEVKGQTNGVGGRTTESANAAAEITEAFTMALPPVGMKLIAEQSHSSASLVVRHFPLLSFFQRFRLSEEPRQSCQYPLR
jgi:hypothetical protein